MTEYVSSALFIYSQEGHQHVDQVSENPYGTSIVAVPFEELLKDEKRHLPGVSHVVVCGELDVIKKVIALAREYHFSVGFIPLDSQPYLYHSYGVPKEFREALSLALRSDPKEMDLVLCNGHIVLLKATVGRIPLVDTPESAGKAGILISAFKKISSLRLLPFTITTSGSNVSELSTAACGCILFSSPDRVFASGLTGHDSSFSDGLLSLVVVAPMSIVDYLMLMLQTMIGVREGALPDSIGFIKSPAVIVTTEERLPVVIDGEQATQTPIDCSVIKAAVRINHGKDPLLESKRSAPGKEKFITRSLPAGKELAKARNKHLPFYPYASEERFKDLFVALRGDARVNVSYLVLMVLSTVLATVGLYMNSASVIIGAMLLAPLMAPIIALAMGLLRMERGMVKEALWKIAVGVGLALSTGALITLLFPYQPLTPEMQGRLNPTVMDLIVAVSAGIAGAYTKSYKEILQSLAGVAIAVALVPPLATAGIGIGRLDVLFFNQAFLLFITNLIGIVLAATLTFRVLGFSPVVRGKRGLGIIFVVFLIVCIPLSIAYKEITEKADFEKSWKVERFMVGDKYLIVQRATLTKLRRNEVLTVDILARDQLNRHDLNEFKRKLKKNFPEDLVIRANVTYIP
ncbi:MAG: DUF389 domain-containing protein [Desulforhopalus sp.]